MKQRILILIAILATLLLTGCGAEVSSMTKFKEDGSGTRTVSAIISGNDAKNLEGGFIELDKLLEEAAPESVNLNRKNLDNGDALYEFSFHFDDIEDYNKKIQSITGKPHNATWYTTQSIFLSDIQFQEENCTYELISWALEAFKNSKYAKWFSQFKPYQIGDSVIYVGNEQVYKGTGNPSFTKQMSSVVKKVSIYNDYDYNNQYSKTIVMQFNPGDLEKINIEEAKHLLNAYSKDYKMDLANSTITFELTNDAVKDFIMSADLNCQDDNFIYEGVFNPFQKKIEIKEQYNLGQFFSLFQLEYPYIYNYIKLPENLEDLNVSHTNQIGEIDIPEGYQYAGAFRYDKDYQVNISSNTMVDIKQVKLNLQVGDSLDGKRVIEIQFSKNGCELQKNELVKYYPDCSEILSYSDQGDMITLSFMNRFKKGKILEAQQNDLSFIKKSRFSLKNVVYELQDDLSIESYLPQINGYRWDIKEIPIVYNIQISKDAKLKGITIYESQYDLFQHSVGTDYIIEGESTEQGALKIQIQLKSLNSMFYLGIFLFIFLIIIGILIYVLIRVKEKIEREQSDMAYDIHNIEDGFNKEEE